MPNVATNLSRILRAKFYNKSVIEYENAKNHVKIKERGTLYLKKGAFLQSHNLISERLHRKYYQLWR